MRTLASLCVLIATPILLLAGTLTREEAQAIAERSAMDGGVILGDFAMVRSRREPSGEWSFLYKCKSNLEGCQFFTTVNSETGHVTTSAEVEERVHKQMTARTTSALASKTKKGCEDLGGTWLKSGMSQQEFCDIKSLDAGKTCTDSVQCESLCLAEENKIRGAETTGRCDEWHHSLGRCINEVKGGIVVGGRCTD